MKVTNLWIREQSLLAPANVPTASMSRKRNAPSPLGFIRENLKRRVFGCLAGLLFSALALPAQVINFDVPGGEGGKNFSGQGAINQPGDNYWIPIVPNGTTAPGTLSDGVTASPITFTEAQSGDYNGDTGTVTAGTPGALEYYYAYASNSAIKTNTLNHLAAGSYNLYLYGINGGVASGRTDRGCTFAVYSDLTTATNLSTVNTTAGWSAFIQGNNYVVFSNVLVGAGATITIVYTHNPNATGIAGNTEGDFNGLQLQYSPVGAPPTITTEPSPQRLYQGGTARFAIAANPSPTGALTYQWQTNGVNLKDGTTASGSVISGSASSALTVADVGPADQLNYQVTVLGTNGVSTNSIPVALTIQAPNGEPYEAAVIAAKPLYFYEFNELVNASSGTALTYDYAGEDSGIYGTNALNGYNDIAGPTAATGFPGFAVTNTAVQFTPGNTFDNVSISSPWNLNTNSLTITAWINPNSGAESVSQQIVFSRNLNANDTNASPVAGFGFGANLDANNQPTLGYTWNDDDAGTFNWNSGLEVPANQWSFVALSLTPTNATLSIMNANGLAFATHVYAHVPQNLTQAVTMIGDDPADTTGANVFPGTIDDVAVFNQAFSFSQLTNLFNAASGRVSYPPFIAVQPLAQSEYPGYTVQFSALAGGSGALSYQWQADSQGNGVYANLTDGATSGGSVVSGSQTPTLTIVNLGAADANNYQLIVSGYGAPATSAAALLTVLPMTGGAQSVTTAVTEVPGQDWNTASTWSSGQSAYATAASSPGSTFEVLPGALLYSVNNETNLSFPGEQLTIDGTNQVGVPAELLLDHPSPATTFFFQDLTLNGGKVDNGNDGLVTLEGGLEVVTNSLVASDPVGVAINFDVPGTGITTGSADGASQNYAGQGAYADPGHNYWNSVVNNGTTPPATDADGVTVSPVTFTSSEQFVYNANAKGELNGAQGTPAFLETAYEGITSAGTESDTLNNVPPGTYTLYLYGCNGGYGTYHNRGTTFWVSSDLTPAVTNSTYNTADGFNQFIEGNDYIVFKNIVVGAGGTIHLSYTANPLANTGGPTLGPNTEADFNGLQLVKVNPSATPRPINIAAQLSGTGTLQFTTPDTGFASDLNISGTTNTFTGQWNVTQGALLGSGLNSLGTNSITVLTNGALETLYDINDSNGILFLNGRLFLHQHDTFASVAVNGVFLAPGTYSASALTGLNATAFPASWPQQVGSTFATSSGSLTVLSSPAPVFTGVPTPATLTVYQEQSAQFTIAPALGAGTISYRWQANGGNVSNGNMAGLGTVTGATTTNLTIVTGAAGSFNLDLVASSSTGSSTSSVAVLTVLPILPATTATLQDVQSVGNDWNTASDWDLGIGADQLASQYPGSTNIVPAGTVLNTPDSGGATPFPGSRLILPGDGNFVDNNGDTAIITGVTTTSELRASEISSSTIYFPDLQMAGGQLDNSGNNVGNSNAGQSQGFLDLTGEIDIVSNATFYSDSGVRTGSLRTIQIDAWLTGSGTIQYSAFNSSFNSNNLVVTCSSNTFNGQWLVTQGALVGGGLNSLGTNSITVGTNGALETLYNLNDPGASLTLNGEMFLHSSDVFNSVTIGGNLVSPGTYSYATLAAEYPANFPATWLLQIGSTVSNASGSLTVLTGPPPPQSVTITQADFSASQGTFTLSGTNGVAATSYHVLTTTNLALPLSQWIVITNGTFDSSGDFEVALPYSSANSQGFFLISTP